MTQPLYIVDAFTTKHFAGNPAAVCPLTEWPDDVQLQSIAAENNLSETAFFIDRGDRIHLRWFTPRIEVSLCGHATLATSYVLFHHLKYKRETIVFETLSGLLHVKKGNGMLLMDFPANIITPCDIRIDSISEALGEKPARIVQSPETCLAEFVSEAQIRSIAPDYMKLEQMELPCTIITAPGDNVDFVSRFFAPKIGIPEDPVTGSAHCTLVPYWAEKLHKKEFHALQVSQRGGELFCTLRGDRVQIGGHAVTYAVGDIL